MNEMPSTVASLVETKIKTLPSLAPLRANFYESIVWAAGFGAVCLALMVFAPHLVVWKLSSAIGLLYYAVRMHKTSALWSEAVHNEYTALSQKLLEACRSCSIQNVKTWSKEPKVEPWAKHVMEQYLKNYATAAM